jgi:anthranilate phosphoribosyltransferase
MKAGKGSLLKFRSKIESGHELSHAEASELFEMLRRERDVVEIASLLLAWSEKGYSVDEIAACAAILRSQVKKVDTSHEVFIDVVGTGGSRTKTFNVSTAAAFVASGAGLPVAKHGNRAASSKTGSADALSELGVGLAANADSASRSLDNHGICFMFAPHFHNLTKELADARRSVGRPTIFNLLGPIANPAGAPFQLIGLWDGRKAMEYGAALATLGTKRTWIVHGSDGLDEITLSGHSEIAEVTGNGVEHFEIAPSDFGIEEQDVDDLKAGSPEQSARTVLGVLKGEIGGSARDLVTMNAAAALYLAGNARDLKTGREMAEESIDSGEAERKLNALIEETNK